MNTKSLCALVAGVGLLGAAVVQPAMADPASPATATQLVGVGSDTTQEVVDALSAVLLDANSNPIIANFGTNGGDNTTPIVTRTGCSIQRPVNSGEGRNAVAAANGLGTFGAWGPTAVGCVDFARSSSYSSTAVYGQPQALTYIPMAQDNVTYMTLGASVVSKNLTKTQLKDIYQCVLTGPANAPFQPMLPKSGSGTRSTFLSYIGVADAASNGSNNGYGTCVKSVAADGVTPVEENDGRFITNKSQLIPVSVAQYVAQSYGASADIRSRTTLGAIDGGSGLTYPTNLNTGFAATRLVYNVIPSAALNPANDTGTNNYATIRDTFVGTGSKVCQATSTLSKYGFVPLTNGTGTNVCGDTSRKSG